jgi:pyruvate,orthophosphate dikinase
MPGMLDTVLNVGCSLPAVHGLVRMTGHPRFGNDCRRRFLESYGTVVLGIDRTEFANTRDALVAAEHVGSEAALVAMRSNIWPPPTSMSPKTMAGC